VLGLLVVWVLVALSQCGQGLSGLEGLGLDGGGLAEPTQSTGLITAEEVAPAGPTNTAVRPQATRPAVVPSGPTTGESWLVMLYQDADDRILEKDIFVDLNEAERVGSTENVRIVTQIDRFAGGYADDGNWTGTRRYLVTQDDDLNRVGSQVLQDLGEANMADGATLVDFVTWAVESFPSDRYALIMSDHGMGWPGGWSDPDPSVRSSHSAPIAANLGNQLYLDELDAALRTIRQQTGIEQFELIGLDACLMGQLEVYSTLAPHARYAVASEETEPALGWAYASFLGDLVRDPTMDGAKLGSLIVNSYVREDQRIVDDVARADLLKQGSPLGGMFGFTLPSSEEIGEQMSQAVTLSAIDLSQVQTLTNRVNELSLALQQADQNLVARARNYAQPFTSVFGSNVPASYIDLGHFALLLQKNSTGAVQQAAGNVVAALNDAVIAETHGSGKPGATGVAIYFPNSQLFGMPQTGPQSYSVIASEFAGTSLWDDYLAFHYTGRGFSADSLEAVVPDSGATVTAPGGAGLSISAVGASSSQVSIGDVVLLSADISSDNLGHVLLFAGYLDPLAGSHMIMDMDYLESSDTRELEGVYYPEWPDGEFKLEFEWEPIVWYLYDGEEAVFATLKPETYGAAPENAVYTVDGIYTYGSAEGGSRFARLYLMNGSLQRVFGFTGDKFEGAPREIHPQSGDTFTVLEEWLDLNEQGRVVDQEYELGGTLTFRDQMFTYDIMDAPSGGYLVGFIARDLDGQAQQAYTQITVN
ncbi:MAG: clostripain-related cysteine peptidase, partial [Anaerolineae bacterium]